MIILQDSREQSPLGFSGFEYVTETRVQKLEVGDYMCEFADGYIPKVSFERKSFGDLFGTMGKGYKRFKAEMERAEAADIQLIIMIEGGWDKVGKGFRRSAIAGNTIQKKLQTLFVSHGVYFVNAGTRAEMASWVYEHFCAIGRLKGKRKGKP